MRSLPTAPVFDRAALRALGWSDGAITRAIHSGRLVRLRRGMLCLPPAPDHAAALAAAAACTGSVVSHRSALLMHDLPTVGPRPAVPEVTVSPFGVGSLTGAHLYRASLPPEHVVSRNGVSLTSAPRTLVDIGRDFPLAMAVAATDAALHDKLAHPAELDDVLRFCWTWPGIRRAQRAVRLADARAESPLETISRLTMIRLRLPRPEPQATIVDELGRFVARCDFYWDEFGVVGEADGRSKYDDRAVLTAEKARQELLEELGIVVVRWGWDAVTRTPRLLVSRLERAFERGRLRDRSGFRRLWSVVAG